MNAIRELVAMIKVKRQYSNVKVALRDDQQDLKFCYDILSDVSRSFAVVIIQLHPELRDAVCLFYLALRALDTVEDDTAVPLAFKKECLPVFHEKLYDETYHIDGVGKGQERVLLEQFPRMSRAFVALKGQYRDVISDITYRMAMGMLHFLENEVVTKKDYDLYCHYVAGLVGHGLSRLFCASGLEAPSVGENLEIANSMGLFLQKVNIVRDYYEDIMEEPPRMFWPREVWGQFSPNGRLDAFKDPANRGQAVECLNALVADALRHVAHCVEFLSGLKEPTVFLFCAIPQVMAIATLAEVYNNPRVFDSKVKIRKGIACRTILESTNLENALALFSAHLDVLERKLTDADPSYDVTRQGVAEARRNIAAATRAKGAVDKNAGGYARAFFMQFPTLGGRILYQLVDSVSGLVRSERQ